MLCQVACMHKQCAYCGSKVLLLCPKPALWCWMFVLLLWLAGAPTFLSSSKSRQAVTLPVASLTLSSSNKSSTLLTSRDSSRDVEEVSSCCSSSSSGDQNVLASAGEALQQLMSAAVPINITIQL